MEKDMSKTYTPQERAVLTYLEEHGGEANFMKLREFIFTQEPDEKELFHATLTNLSMHRLTTSKLVNSALWMEITDDGLATLRAS
jgi:hypothetical protein